MTMTPDELRALADALDPSGKVLTHPGESALQRAAAHLRAQADAQPVAWLYYSKHASQPFTTTCPPNTWGPNADDDRKTAVALYTHPAPAAPHYAMLDSHRRLVEQAIQSAEHPSGMSTHDGKARIDASILRRMLAIIDSLPAAPQEK